MKRMAESNVLLIGMSGLGLEIAKNIILMGVRSVTIHDDQAVTLRDLSSQFYVSEKDIGSRRSDASLRKLQELNRYVTVSAHVGALSDAAIGKFQVVVMTQASRAEELRVAGVCRAHGVSFISAQSRGLAGYIFCDLGNSFTVYDPDGEEPLSVMIASVTQENPGVVTTLDESRHGFQDADHVTFTEVVGMTQLNNSPPRPIKVLGPYTFSIEDTSAYQPYQRGGYATQVKLPTQLHFLPLPEALAQPEFLRYDFAHFDRPEQLHILFQALDAFATQHAALPAPHDPEHAAKVLALCKHINGSGVSYKVDALDEPFLTKCAMTAAGDINPMAAVLGGIAAQEVLKASSGKFTPIKQWFYFDAIDALPSNPIPKAAAAPVGSRYDAQIAVFGQDTQRALGDLKYFLVGAGAIGCEMLKNWAMMGLGAGTGAVHVTDMDAIEKSNLSRQFLFREADIGKMKSTTAAEAAQRMNPAMHVLPNTIRVAPETEDVYDDDFWDALDGVCNALDNVQARLYVDRRCVYFRKSLLESGTLGTKGNTQVVVPFLTENYGASHDPPEKSIPICTLKNFPNAIEHTIQWARDLFEGLFRQGADDVNAYLNDPNYLQWLEKQPPGARGVALDNLMTCLVKAKPSTFEDCIVWARLKFEELYNNTIRQLLYSLPPDLITASGVPFWSGPKRPPSALEFNADDALHLGFVIAAANLHAANYGIPAVHDAAYVKDKVQGVMVPEFTPEKGVKIATTDSDAAASSSGAGEVDADNVKRTLAQLPTRDALAAWRMAPAVFEKDDDSNFHIDFVVAASNLRARNYKITEADRLKTKGIAGKIIPAIATTTSVVAGLVCIELIKVLLKKGVTELKNGFVNLALPFFGFSDPIEAPKNKMLAKTWTLWDRFDMDMGTDITLAQFLDYFKKEHGLEVCMLSCGQTLVFSSFGKAVRERMQLKMSDLVRTISKTEPRPRQRWYVFEVCCNDADGNDVDVPYVRYRFRFD